MIKKHLTHFDWLIEWNLAGNGGRIKDRYTNMTEEEAKQVVQGYASWRKPKAYKLTEVSFTKDDLGEGQ